ncbi:MAG: chromosomal replication initiator protein DnaA [Elusimicrobiota bacterium]
MALDNWELSYQPCEKDKNRWQLKLRIPEKELMSVVNQIEGTRGRPSALDENEYNFSVYIYELGEEGSERIRELLHQICPQGNVRGPSKEEALDAMLEKFAHGMDAAEESAKEKKEAAKKHDAKEKEKEKEAPREIKTEEPAPPPPGKPDESAARSQETGEKVATKYSQFQDLALNKNYTFEEFVIGPNNRFTAAAAQAVADNPGKIYNPFFIYGGVGLGKTHLMHAVGQYVMKRSPSLRILYVTTEKFMSEVIESIRRGSLQVMREHYREIDLLLIDDIQFLVESESTQEEFFHTFNVLHQSGKQIIITSDRPPKQLTTLEDRLRSRFEWGLIADIKSPNLETRVAILKKKGEIEHFKLDDNIMLYIASKLKSNIRELEGFLKRINAYATLTHQEVNMDLAKSLMADLLPAEELEEHAQQAPASRPPVASAPPAPAAEPPKPAPPREPEAPAPKPMPSPQETVTPTPKPASPPQEAEAPAPKPVLKPARPAAPQAAKEQSDSSGKVVEVAFFFPENKEAELERVKERFRDVIKKHKLKFQLEGVFERAYSCEGKINYAFFSELCKTNGIPIAIVVGPSPESNIDVDDFANLLATVMDDEKISLQFIPWAEMNKDYRYLNLSLDITLLKHKS